MVLLDTRTPGTSREIYSEDADGETRTRNPSVITKRERARERERGYNNFFKVRYLNSRIKLKKQTFQIFSANE